jgi:uncharacterized membrane protein YhdT
MANNAKLALLTRLFLVVLLLTTGLLICGPGVLTVICGMPSPDGQVGATEIPLWCNTNANLLPLIIVLIIVLLISLLGLVTTLAIRLIYSLTIKR